MALIKTRARGLKLDDTFAFTGTVSGAGGIAGTNAFSVTLSSDQTGNSDNTDTKVAFNSEVYDPDGVFNNSNYRFTAPAAGKYVISPSVNFWPSQYNAFQSRSTIYKNGSEISGGKNRGGLLECPQADNDIANTKFTTTFVLDLAQNDYIEIYVRCRSGGQFTIDSGSLFEGYRLT